MSEQTPERDAATDEKSTTRAVQSFSDVEDVRVSDTGEDVARQTAAARLDGDVTNPRVVSEFADETGIHPDESDSDGS